MLQFKGTEKVMGDVKNMTTGHGEGKFIVLQCFVINLNRNLLCSRQPFFY